MRESRLVTFGTHASRITCHASLLEPLRGIDNHVAVASLIANLEPAGFALFQAEGAERLEDVFFGGFLFLVHGDSGLAVGVMNDHGYGGGPIGDA